MSEIQIYSTLAVFGVVILVIAFDLVDMALAALLGVSVLIALGILREPDVIKATRTAGGPLLLLFGGMVVARTLATTGLFERIGNVYLRATRGSGKRFLLLLLTLVGDPATFLVGSSIGMSFGEYLRRVSLGGLIALLAVVPLMPLLMKDLWRTQRTLPPPAPPQPLPRPWFTAFVLAVLAAMVFLFIFGEDLPTRLIPPAVAVIAAALALMVVFESKAEPVDNIVRDVDWKTLLFLACIRSEEHTSELQSPLNLVCRL